MNFGLVNIKLEMGSADGIVLVEAKVVQLDENLFILSEKNTRRTFC